MDGDVRELELPHRGAELGGLSPERATSLLEALPNAFALLDADWRFTWVNAASARMARSSREAMLGAVAWDVFPTLQGGPVERAWLTAVTEQRETSVEMRVPGPPDHWLEVRAWPDGDGLATSTVDVTVRHLDRETAERSAARADLLTRASEAFGGALDPQEAGARLCRLVVSALADWCVVSFSSGEARSVRHGLSSTAWWHDDASARVLVERFASLTADDLDRTPVAPSGTFARLVEGRSTAVPHGAAAVVAARLPDGDARRAVLELAPESAVVVPLPGRHGLVGILSCFSGPGRPPPGGDDVALLADLAGRAGLAMEAAHLRGEQRRLGEALQRSLLTDPPQPEACEIAVRYTPAAHSVHVGGDWYDAFQQCPGTVMLVIGDVVGHDTEAAAAMGQVRGMLRGLGVVDDSSPATLLGRVDTAMARLAVETTATALVARLENAGPGADGAAVLRWCSAGHLPPLVVTPQGRARVLPTRSGLMLGLEGITGGAVRSDATAELAAGSTVLLCTDGLVERRGTPLDAGLEALRAALEQARELPLEELCDAVLARLVPEHPEDDVALIAVRLRTPGECSGGA